MKAMKELTIEEKAKRYDEAISQLKGLLEGIHEEKCDIMEEDITNIFPELKESEDERIKKEIIEYLRLKYEDPNAIKVLMNENVIGKIINVRETLRPHDSELGCGTIGKVTIYLGCKIGEIYIAFNELKNSHLGTIAKIKRDFYGGSGCIAPFGKDDEDKNNENMSYDSNAIVYFANYKYIMRIS